LMFILSRRATSLREDWTFSLPIQLSLGISSFGTWAAVTLSHELPLDSFELDSPLMHWNGFNAS
jgi:hypothetical protein